MNRKIFVILLILILLPFVYAAIISDPIEEPIIDNELNEGSGGTTDNSENSGVFNNILKVLKQILDKLTILSEKNTTVILNSPPESIEQCNWGKYHVDYPNFNKLSFFTNNPGPNYWNYAGDYTALLYLPGTDIQYAEINVTGVKVFAYAVTSTSDVYINHNLCRVYADGNTTLFNLCPEYFHEGLNIFRYVTNSTYGLNITRMSISMLVKPANC